MSSPRGLRRKSKDAVGYLVTLFVVFPAIVALLGLISGIPVNVLGALLTLYYIACVLAVTLGGLTWLERHHS